MQLVMAAGWFCGGGSSCGKLSKPLKTTKCHQVERLREQLVDIKTDLGVLKEQVAQRTACMTACMQHAASSLAWAARGDRFLQQDKSAVPS